MDVASEQTSAQGDSDRWVSPLTIGSTAALDTTWRSICTIIVCFLFTLATVSLDGLLVHVGCGYITYQQRVVFLEWWRYFWFVLASVPALARTMYAYSLNPRSYFTGDPCTDCLFRVLTWPEKVLFDSLQAPVVTSQPSQVNTTTPSPLTRRAEARTPAVDTMSKITQKHRVNLSLQANGSTDATLSQLKSSTAVQTKPVTIATVPARYSSRKSSAVTGSGEVYAEETPTQETPTQETPIQETSTRAVLIDNYGVVDNAARGRDDNTNFHTVHKEAVALRNFQICAPNKARHSPPSLKEILQASSPDSGASSGNPRPQLSAANQSNPRRVGWMEHQFIGASRPVHISRRRSFPSKLPDLGKNGLQTEALELSAVKNEPGRREPILVFNGDLEIDKRAGWSFENQRKRLKEQKGCLKEREERLQGHEERLPEHKERIKEFERDINNSVGQMENEEAERMLNYWQKINDMTEEWFKVTGNIWVMVRLKAVEGAEQHQEKAHIQYFEEDQGKMILRLPKQSPHSKTAWTDFEFVFDSVFRESATNELIFKKVQPMVQAGLSGANVCIIGDGQSGAGKSFTLFTGPDAISKSASRQIFRWLKDREQIGWRYRVTISALEVYRGEVKDVAAENGSNVNVILGSRKYELRGLRKRAVSNVVEADRLFEDICGRRTNRSTNKNSVSSRSHLVAMLSITSACSDETFRSTIWLVDLAGSELLSTTEIGWETDATRLAETREISLERSDFHNSLRHIYSSRIPTDSMLAKILYECLSNEPRILLLANVSPFQADAAATYQTLKSAKELRETKDIKSQTNVRANG